MKLADRKCVPCEKGAVPVPAKDAKKYLKEISGWKITGRGKWLERKMKFKNFMSALKFVNHAGKIAEAQGHHPDLSLGWGYCNIRVQTHSIGGLHENDFILAAKINKIPV